MDESGVRKIVMQVLREVAVKKVGDTPLEKFDLANKGYVDSHAGSIKAGQADQNLAVSSGLVQLTHGFGSTPAFISIIGSTNNAGTVYNTMGTYDGTTAYFVSTFPSGTNWGSGYIVSFTDGTNYCKATITLDSTHINLTWSANGGLSGTLHFIWQVS